MSKKVLSALLSVALVLAVLWTGAVNFSAPAKADAEKVLSEELKGYRRITPADIVDSTGARVMENDNDGDDSLYTLAGNNKKVFYDGNFGGKTYLDANVNFGGGDNRIFWQTDPSLADVRRNTLFLWFKDGNFRVSYYNNAASPSVNGIVEANGSDYGIDNSTTFNIKLLTDVQKASPSAATETVYYQLWINDQYVGEGTATLASHDKCIAEYGTNASKITMRVPTAPEKDIETELAGYRRIDMFDYDKTVTDGVVSFVAADKATSYITDFDKTYLDVDLNYTSSSAQFQYLSCGTGNMASLFLYFVDETKVRLRAYLYDDKNTLLAWDKSLDAAVDDYGISTGNYFNLKLRTDITPKSENVDTVFAQMWLNNRYAGELTVDITYSSGTHTRNKIYTTSSISVRSATDVETQTKGSKRVIPNDFETVVTTYDVSGCGSGSSHSGGKYKGNLSDLEDSYLDIDVNEYRSGSHQDTFLTWLSAGNASSPLYGTGYQLRFSVNNSNHLLIKKMSTTSSVIATIDLGDISGESYNAAVEETFFNLKVKTRIYGANSIKLLVFVNNSFLASTYITDYDASMISGMNGLGINRLAYRRTPIYDGRLEDIQYDLSDGDYTLYGTEIRVNGVSYSNGDTLTERGVYEIERSNGGATEYQLVKICDYPDFKGHSLVLDARIGVNFFVSLSGLTESEKAATYMTFNVEGSTKEKRAVFDSGFTDESGHGYYGFVCKLSSVQMADAVTPTLHYMVDGEEQTLVGTTYSAKDYIDYVVSHPALYEDNVVNLVRALGNYGYYAQQNFSSKTVTALSTDYRTVSDYSGSYETKKALLAPYEHVKAVGATYRYNLNFDSETILLVRYNETLNVTFSSVENGGEAYTNWYNRYSDTQQFVEIQLPLPVLLLEGKFTVTGIKDGTPFTITDISAFSYIYGVLDTSSKANLKNMLCALHDYYLAASKYKYGVDTQLDGEWF